MIAPAVSLSRASGAPGTVTRPCQHFPEPSSGAGGACRWYLAAEARPSAVPAARHAARRALAGWHLGHVADDAELVLTELLANAVQATQAAAPAGQKIAAYLALDLGRLFILVWDCRAEPPAHAGPADADAESGRGPNCPASTGGSVTITGASFALAIDDCRSGPDRKPTMTDVFGYFVPPGSASDVIMTSGLEVPITSPIARLAHQVSASPARIARAGDILRRNVADCPCRPCEECPALDEVRLLEAMERALG